MVYCDPIGNREKIGMFIQGCTKRWTPGSVNMKRKNCVLLPAAGRRAKLFHLIFTEPGVHLLVHPCKGPIILEDSSTKASKGNKVTDLGAHPHFCSIGHVLAKSYVPKERTDEKLGRERGRVGHGHCSRADRPTFDFFFRRWRVVDHP